MPVGDEGVEHVEAVLDAPVFPEVGEEAVDVLAG
jgi:hypothetical protein